MKYCNMESMLKEQPYLRAEKGETEWFVVSDMLPKNEQNYYGTVAMGFCSREEAEEYIREYGSAKHVEQVERTLAAEEAARAARLPKEDRPF
jgi:hypothetical protein